MMKQSMLIMSMLIFAYRYIMCCSIVPVVIDLCFF